MIRNGCYNRLNSKKVSGNLNDCDREGYEAVESFFSCVAGQLLVNEKILKKAEKI